MAVGRPTDYCQEVVSTICERLVEGESLRAICRDPSMPGISTVFQWLSQYKEFQDQYARAREEQAETLAAEIIDIADEGEHKSLVAGDGETIVVFDSTAVARNRLRVDARKWVASKLKPKVYGDRQAIQHTGAEDGPIKVDSSGNLDLRIQELTTRLAAMGNDGST